ncbi:hypothetical protein [Sphingomonas sp.]|jgi:hypothetical protein|uniref:hypothetical protein n=1 Tax=Sphingomonas sp. TaxID=28214 RepID=UPI002E2FCAE7|nr:hypothetical protein [Sphingomonas sp.]HEX4695313.1 hypothetical protein [Sphingomonas sp.]
MRFKMMALIAATMFTVPALAATPAQDSPQPPKDKKICRREPVTGSIVPYKSVCHTRSEWVSIDADNARTVDSMTSGRPTATSRP